MAGQGNRPARGLMVWMICALVLAVLLAILFVTNVLGGTTPPAQTVQAQRETQR